MEMRASGTAGLADGADWLSAFYDVAGGHQSFGLMEIAGGNAVSVINQGKTAIQIVIIGDGDGAVGRRMDGRSRGRSHVHAEMGRHGNAVVDALAAEHTAFDARCWPVETGEKIIVPRRVALARDVNILRFLLDASQDFGRRGHGFLRQAVNPLYLILPHSRRV